MKYSLIKKLLLLYTLMLLTACATTITPVIRNLPALPNNAVFQINTLAENGDITQSLLVVETGKASAWRWIQTDALGAPVARQIWENGQWRNEGFLPPNLRARQLFIATLPLLLNRAQLQQVLPDVIQYTTAQGNTKFRYDNRVLWESTLQTSGGISITFADGTVQTLKWLSE